MRIRTIVLLCMLSLMIAAGVIMVQPALSRTSPTPSQPASTYCSSSYCLDWQVLGGAVGEMSSSSYQMRSTLGQTMAGLFSGASYELSAGYWTPIDRDEENEDGDGGENESEQFLPLIIDGS